MIHKNGGGTIEIPARSGIFIGHNAEQKRDPCIEVYIDLYAKSNHALVQLRLVIVDDEEINHHFSDLENTYFSNIADILKTRGITCGDLFEKVYVSCILIDSLRQEKTSFSHNGLNFEILQEQVKQNIHKMLSD